MTVDHHHAEMIKVAVIGSTGAVASRTLAEWNIIISFLVGVSTLIYVLIKIYYTLKHNGRPPSED